MAITAAMPGSTGLIPFGERFGDRLIDVGIAEQHAVTSAAGMAMGGLRPVVAIYSTFLTRAFDQCVFDVGLHELPVVFAVDRAGVTGPDGASAQGTLDLVLLSKIPGMTVFAPSSYQELQQMLHDALDITTGPVAIRWPRTPAPMVADDEVGNGLSARLVSADADASVCLVGVGKMLAPVCEAAELLRADGIGCTVWDPRVVQPFDPELVASAAGHTVVVCVEDGLREGGAGSRLAELVTDSAAESGAAHPPFVRALGTPGSSSRRESPTRSSPDWGSTPPASPPRPARRCTERHDPRGARPTASGVVRVLAGLVVGHVDDLGHLGDVLLDGVGDAAAQREPTDRATVAPATHLQVHLGVLDADQLGEPAVRVEHRVDETVDDDRDPVGQVSCGVQVDTGERVGLVGVAKHEPALLLGLGQVERGARQRIDGAGGHDDGQPRLLGDDVGLVGARIGSKTRS